jgi:MFS family permease
MTPQDLARCQNIERSGHSGLDVMLAAVAQGPPFADEIVHASETGARSSGIKRPLISRRVSFWVVSLATGTLLAASAAPSPLYPVYQNEFKFSDILLTIIFAVYVFALVVSLLTVGRISDYLGRRGVLAFALALEISAMAMFAAADGVSWLLWARVVQGLATGTALGALSAYLLDLQPGADTQLGSLVNSVSSTTGLGLGAILTGILVEVAPQPTRLVFVVFLALFAVLFLTTVALPETVSRVPGAASALQPRIAVPVRARRAFVGATPTIVATWSLGGLVLSLGGSLLGSVFGQLNHAVIGLVIGIFSLSGAISTVLVRKLSPASMVQLSGAVLVIGTSLFVVALWWPSFTLFVVASVVAGAGFGPGFLGSLRAVSRLADPHERAALLSAVFVVSYLAFSVPAVIAGVLITHIGLRNTAFWYSGFVVVVALVAVFLETVLRSRQRSASRAT